MTNPVETVLYVPERISIRHDYPASYQPDPDWEVRLHGWLGAAWPCPERGRVDTLLHDIAAELQTQGLRMGRQTYGEYSDAEVSTARATCALCCINARRLWLRPGSRSQPGPTGAS